MELIKKWLSGSRNYHIGVVLYNQFGKDEKLKQYFKGSPDNIKQDRLAKELSALQQKPIEALLPALNSEADEMPESKDPALKALKNEWSPLYQRMQYLRHELDRYTGNTADVIEKRRPIAKEILQLEQDCMEIWARRDYYLKHKTLPNISKEEDPIPTDPVELGKKIETLKRNIRRNKKLSEQHPDNVVYAIRVKDYQEQLDKILNKIKDDEQGTGKI